MITTIQKQVHNVEEVYIALPAEVIKRRLPKVQRILSALKYQPDPLEIRYGRPLPVQLINRYAMLAALRAETEQLEDGTWYAEIRNFPGVWAQGESEEEAVKELEAIVRDWTLLKIQDRDRDLPVIDDIDLNVL
jgi:predicted RNase H-like HicB family nuclease